MVFTRNQAKEQRMKQAENEFSVDVYTNNQPPSCNIIEFIDASIEWR